MNPSIYDSLGTDTPAVAEALSVMLHVERTTYKSCDYLHPPMPHEAMINESDRVKIVEWCYSVVDQCRLNRETVAITMAIVDRFLSAPNVVAQDALHDRRHFQLVSITALYVAIKTNERVVLSSSFFAEMSHEIYTVDDIEAMEMSMLNALSWRICAPTSIQSAHHILSLVLPHVNLKESTWGFILDEVRYQTENAVRNYYLSTQRPSTVAVAAIFNALDQVDEQDRRAILGALLSIVDEDFDSPRDLLAARNRLQDAMKANEALPGDDTSASEARQEIYLQESVW